MNPKIEKTKEDIAKAKAKIAELQAKIRELTRLKFELENEEIVALYRRENLNEEQFKALLRSQRKDEHAAYTANDETAAQTAENESAAKTANNKEVMHNATDKN